ncbi:MAG: hypothetical protein MSS60_03565 [Clostridiales bacterium]|nr:hypothetical protein [Clostridiales bacterium]
MTEAQKKMADAFGLTEKDFQPKEVSEAERVAILEDAFAELCEVIFNG